MTESAASDLQNLAAERVRRLTRKVKFAYGVGYAALPFAVAAAVTAAHIGSSKAIVAFPIAALIGLVAETATRWRAQNEASRLEAELRAKRDYAEFSKIVKKLTNSITSGLSG